MDKKEVRVGDRFGKLVVITAIQKSRNGTEYCFVNCDCGKKGIQTKIDVLLSGKKTHCGCERKQATSYIGVKSEPLHRVWGDMIMRCENPKRPYYYLYGGRGIKVCKEWRDRDNGYKNFRKWSLENGYKFIPMETKKPTKRIKNQYTLDRIDVNGDYCPENCQWVDYRLQNEHKRQNIVVEFRGEKNTCKYFVKKYNSTISYFNYLLREGNSEVQAIEIIAK